MSSAIQLEDEATRKAIPGLVRIDHADPRQPIALPELVRRPNHWYAMPDHAVVVVPQTRLVLQVVHSLEWELATTEVDLNGKEHETVRIPLRRFYDPADNNLRSGNTHLHLNRISRDESDRYLRVVPAADGLDLLYVSYLERIKDGLTYVTNTYTPADLERLSQPNSLLRHGEEHRHNFEPYGEGYGHVMFLDIKRLIQPVSIGPGITGKGTDGVPIRRGIEAARADGASVIWCHNTFGVEDIPNWIAGKLHGQNIFDGGAHGTYKDTFYRYLNIGLKVPFSTGTDWFVYDFSRVYVPIEGPLTSEAWLKQLAAGKTFITNGTFLEFQVDGRDIGDTIALAEPRDLRVRGRAVGRNNFRAIELLYNGKVIHTAACSPEDGHYRADLQHVLRVKKPGWTALRVVLETGKNELDQTLFAHTSPIYLQVEGKSIFMLNEAEQLKSEMERNLSIIDRKAVFANDQEREAVLKVHREGISLLRQRMLSSRP